MWLADTVQVLYWFRKINITKQPETTYCLFVYSYFSYKRRHTEPYEPSNYNDPEKMHSPGKLAHWSTDTKTTRAMSEFDIQTTMNRDILLQNQLDALISQVYFWNGILHVLDSLSVHHRESSTIHTAIGICFADWLLASSQQNVCDVYDIYLLLCV